MDEESYGSGSPGDDNRYRKLLEENIRTNEKLQIAIGNLEKNTTSTNERLGNQITELSKEYIKVTSEVTKEFAVTSSNLSKEITKEFHSVGSNITTEFNRVGTAITTDFHDSSKEIKIGIENLTQVANTIHKKYESFSKDLEKVKKAFEHFADMTKSAQRNMSILQTATLFALIAIAFELAWLLK